MTIKSDNLNKDSKVPKKKDQSIFITCFTDASFCQRTKAWGVSFWIKGENKYILRSFGGKGNISKSTMAEELALEKAIDFIYKKLYIKDKVIVIQSDCVPALKNVSIKKLTNNGAKVIKKHVKGHIDNKTKRTFINNLVDSKAREQMIKYRKKNT